MNPLLYTVGRMFAVFANPACLGYLALGYLLTLIALPLSYRLLHRTRVAWVAAARVLGMLVLGWAAWWLGYDFTGNGGSIFPLSGLGLWILAVAFGALSVWGWRRWGRGMARRLRSRWRVIFAGEILFLAAFAFCAVLRMHSHGIRDQEKFMDFAFLNACIYSHHTPPPDPWRYELPINYYYGGYLQMSVPAKMTGVAPEIAYNLAVALLFAWSVVLAFAIGWELTRRIPLGVLAAVVLLLMGNADVISQRWQYWSEGDTGRPFSVNVWRSSRVIKDGMPNGPQHETINEFPFFSFLHADLHPHMVAVPYVLLFLCLLLNLTRGGARRGAFGRGGWRWARAVATGGVLGALAMINGFDFITFGFVLGLALLARAWIEARSVRLNLLALGLATCGVAAVALWKLLGFLRRAWGDRTVPEGDWMLLLAIGATLAALAFAVWLAVAWLRKGRPVFSLLRAGLWLALLLGVAFVSHAPFFLGYHAPLHGGGAAQAGADESAGAFIVRHMQTQSAVGLSDWRSGIGEFLAYWGVFALTVLAWAGLGFQRLARRAPQSFGWAPWAALGVAWAVGLAWPGTVATASMLAVLAGLAAGWPGWSRRGASRFVVVAILACVVIVLGCEFFYLRDAYGRGLQRMNTLFKFYYPCWIMLSLVLPFALMRFARARILPFALRIAVVALAGGIIVMCLEYPLGASVDRIRGWRNRGIVTLDGMDWLRRDSKHPGDYGAIMWLRKNAPANAVVAEAVGGSYTHHARIATHTQLRAVLGWPGHEGLWRGKHPTEIERDMRALFGKAGFRAVGSLLEKYHVDYVVVGSLEKESAGAQAWRKFEGHLERVYYDEEHDVRIYRVKRN